MRVVVAGSGRPLDHVCRSLMAKNIEVVVICSDRRQADALARELNAIVLVGRGSDVDVMESAACDQAELVLALAPDDAENLVACQLAKQLFGARRCMALVHDPANEPIFTSLGADVTLSVAGFIAEQLELGMPRQGIVRQIPYAQGQMLLVEMIIPQGAPAIGSGVDRKIQGIATSVTTREGRVLAAETPLQAGDYVALIIPSTASARILDRLLGKER